MLKQIVLRQKIKLANQQLDALRAKDAEFTTRAASLQTREAELETAINETTEETSTEDRDLLEAQVTELEKDQAALTGEQEANEKAKTTLTAEIASLQAELDAIESRSTEVPAPAPTPAKKKEREDPNMKTTRTRFFNDVSPEVRRAMFERDDVKQFLQRVRDFKGQQRAVTGAELEIPEVFIELLRDNLNRYSKLAPFVFVRRVNGKVRQTIAGAIPEGIWTEAIGVLNELAISYSQVEVDGYKVGGFIPVPNSTLEDSDLSLANDILDAIGQAIGYAVDKAVIFGTGTKMPYGILTRLAQTSAPSGWGTNRAAWTDLHTSHVLKFDPAAMSAETFFANLVAYLGVAVKKYSDGSKFWAMNEKTYNTIMGKMIVFNTNGALVAAMNNTMPIVGGTIVILDFLADYDIVGGYGSLYLLAERAGAQLAVSDQVKFLEEQTVFKGSARYDGQPVFGEGFVIVNINNASPTTSASFAADTANVANVPYALPVAGTYTGAQAVQLFSNPGTDIYYTVDGSTPDKTKTKYTGAAIAVSASKTIKAIAYKGDAASAVRTAAYTIS